MNGNSSMSLQDFEESEAKFVYDDETGTLERVVDINADYGSERPEGTVTVEDIGTETTSEIDAEDFDFDLNAGDRHVIPQQVIENATDILTELGHQEAGRYTSTLGFSHPYNGINNVSTVRELAAAAQAETAELANN